jgi:hypothetical protein
MATVKTTKLYGALIVVGAFFIAVFALWHRPRKKEKTSELHPTLLIRPEKSVFAFSSNFKAGALKY